MASIYRHGKGWRAQIRKGDERDSATFRTRQEAASWALRRESELKGTRLPNKTLADALRRYRAEVSPSHRGHKWERSRIDAMLAAPLADKRLAKLRDVDVAGWRDGRLAEVSAATVAREMNLLRAVLRTAWRDWHWTRENPMEGVRPPPTPPSRKRRITDDEVLRVMAATGLSDGLESRTTLNRVGLAFLFALETAMRAGEIVGMRWPDVAEKSVTLPRTKNGDERQVPLSLRAREILAALPKGDGPAFGLLPGTRDAMWRKATKGMVNLHFHDSRAEAIWRLSKKLPVLDLARVIGHRDVNSLLIYYNTSADELADRLDSLPGHQ